MNLQKQTQEFTDHAVSRRRFMMTAASLTSAIGAGSLSVHAGDRNDDGLDGHRSPLRRGVTPAPKPIPGGTMIGLAPPFDLIHVFIPGPTGVVLPFSGLPLEGLHVEPSVITDFKGATALAYVVGQADGSDGGDVRPRGGHPRHGGRVRGRGRLAPTRRVRTHMN